MSSKDYTHVREMGTKVFKTQSADEKIAALRTIVEDRQYAVIDGVQVDYFFC